MVVAGLDLSVWCELPRLDPKLDSLPWLLLSDFPGQAPSADLALPLRRTASPWWAFHAQLPHSGDPDRWADRDLERWMDTAIGVADRLGLRRFRVYAGGFEAVAALALAARHPHRIASLVLRAPFIPFAPRVAAYLMALQAVDRERFARTFGLRCDARAIYDALFRDQTDSALAAAQVWANLDGVLSSAAGPAPSGLLPQNMLAERRSFAHALLHGLFVTPQQWVADVGCVARSGLPVGIVQGGADRVCLPGGAHCLSEMLPTARLLELPDIGHRPPSALLVSAVAELVFGQRTPSADLIPLGGRRGQTGRLG